MRESDAFRVVAVLASYFRQEVTDQTAALWSKELTPFETGDALEAAELAGKTQVYMPNLAEFLALVRDCRNTRVVFRPELPAAPDCCRGEGFGHFYRDHADAEMRVRVDKLLQVDGRRRSDETVIQEAFARMVGS